MNSELVIVEPFPQAFGPACGCEDMELIIVLGERATDTTYLKLQRL
jgi:hypothetical protein